MDLGGGKKTIVGEKLEETVMPTPTRGDVPLRKKRQIGGLGLVFSGKTFGRTKKPNTSGGQKPKNLEWPLTTEKFEKKRGGDAFLGWDTSFEHAQAKNRGSVFDGVFSGERL